FPEVVFVRSGPSWTAAFSTELPIGVVQTSYPAQTLAEIQNGFELVSAETLWRARALDPSGFAGWSTERLAGLAA
ncbi:MAG: hypothetical protein KC561_09670, partial [Myxococcales bacterium]|nr:hypothetical protein [Myxococcales bacterium]